jgi:N-ethylmaleimide reductase
MKTKLSLTTHDLGSASLSNRIVMAPMTRSRAINNIPNQLMANYYGQRASAGLIITEGVSPSLNGLGYARIPGIFSAEQTSAWKQITQAVHDKGGKIFMQLMHTGRIGHYDNLPVGGRILAPSAIHPKGKMWTDQQGLQDFPVPEALTTEEVHHAKSEFIKAAQNAVHAGFDGVELHAANGYLLEQFLSPHTNQRIDNYGGSIENRTRFVLEVAAGVAQKIGKDKTGIRFSPYGLFNDMPHYDEIDATYTYLAEELKKLSIAYIHLVDVSSDGNPEVPLHLKKTIRDKFNNTIILTGGYNLTSAERDISAGLADLIGFGRPFISNPDLVYRFRKDLPLNIKLDASTFFAADEKGYIDYPAFAEESVGVF